MVVKPRYVSPKLDVGITLGQYNGNSVTLITPNGKDESFEKSNIDDLATRRIVGHVSNANVLISWSSSNKNVTIIAEAELESHDGEKYFEILIQIEGILDISHATLNSSRTVLGLTIRNERKSGHSDISYGNGYHYQGFLISLPQNQLSKKEFWHCLTDSHSFVIQLHFINTSSSSYESSIIVLIYRHSIQVHKIDHKETVSIANSRVLALDFSWSQWIEHQQCLAFLSLQNFPAPKKSLFQFTSNDEQKYALTCVQFFADHHYSTAFSIPAENFLYDEPMTMKQDESLSVNKISYIGVNLHLILWKEGSSCICYQKGLGVRDSESNSDGKLNNLSYIITSLNHGYHLKATISENSFHPSDQLFFAPYDEHQLIVFSKSGPTHIVDLDPCHALGYYIVSDDSCWSIIGKSEYQSLISLPNQGCTLVVLSECRAFTLNISNKELLNLFCYTKSLHNRRSITHFLSAHLKPGLSSCYIRKVLKRLCYDPWHPHIRPVFEEFLKSSSFSNIKRSDINLHNLLYHIPLTENSNNEMHYDFFEKELAVIISTEYNESLNNLPTDSLLLASSSSHHHKFNKNNSLSDDLEQDVTRGDFWHTLWHHQIDLNTRKNSSALAFDFSLLNKEIENSITKQLDGTSSSCSTPDPKSPRKTQIGRTALCSFCVYNSPITSPGDATCPSILNIPSVVSLPFEPVVEDFVKIEKQIKVGWKVLNDHLMMSCPLVAKSVIDKLCTDYIIAQVQQSHILCHAIFNRVEKYRNKKDPKFTNLCSIPHVDLLQCLLELYFMSCQKLSFPLPSGFQVTFCETTFHSLHFDLFIQHVQCGILVLQIDSVKRIIKTLDDTAESMKKKLICIGYLPKEEGEALLKKWKSSIGVRYKEFRTARESLAQNPRSPGVQSINEQDIEFLSQNSTEADVTNDAQEVETPD